MWNAIDGPEPGTLWSGASYANLRIDRADRVPTLRSLRQPTAGKGCLRPAGARRQSSVIRAAHAPTPIDNPKECS